MADDHGEGMELLRTRCRWGKRIHEWTRKARGVIANTDSDALLSAQLLTAIAHDLETSLPVLGFYDNERLWLSDSLHRKPLDRPAEVIWVDSDVRIPGARIITQHVVSSLGAPPVQAMEICNPNEMGWVRGRPYSRKYPFSTFAWLWWVLGLHPPSVSERQAVLTGLVWAQDGAHRSVLSSAFRENCLEWAIDLLPGSPLSPLAAMVRRVGPERPDWLSVIEHSPMGFAARAEDRIRARARQHRGMLTSGWGAAQFEFAARPRPAEIQLTRPGLLALDPATDEGRQRIQHLSGIYAAAAPRMLRPLQIEPMREPYVGTWNSGEVRAAFRSSHLPFSWAQTSKNKASWTSLGPRYGRRSLWDSLTLIGVRPDAFDPERPDESAVAAECHSDLYQ